MTESSEAVERIWRPSTPSLLAVIPAIAGVWRRRELLLNLTVRSMRVQYKQSILGYAWMLLSPLTQLLTLTFIFTIVFDSQAGSHPFILFLSAGLFPWIFFATATASATESVVGSAGIVTAVYFPRDFLVISATLIRVVDFLVALTILLAAFIVYDQPLHWTVLWLPLLFMLQLLFIIGLSLPLAALNLFFHDVHYLVGVALHIWFFFTPIFYALESVPDRYRIIYELNPMARFIDAYRYALLDGVSPPPTSLVLAILMTLGMLTVGYYLFRRMEPRFADRI